MSISETIQLKDLIPIKHVDQPAPPADNQLRDKIYYSLEHSLSPRFTFNFSFMFEVSLIFLYSLMSVA